MPSGNEEERLAKQNGTCETMSYKKSSNNNITGFCLNPSNNCFQFACSLLKRYLKDTIKICGTHQKFI